MTTQPVQLQAELVRIPAKATLLAWAARKLGRLARILLPSPAAWIVTALLAAMVLVVYAVPWLVFVVGLWTLGVLAFWRINFPTGYQTHVAGRARGTVRSLAVYRWRWTRALKRSGVISSVGGVPLLVRTWSTPIFDRLRIRMVAGQRVEDWAEESDRLAQTFGALACRVHTLPNKPHWLELMFLTSEPLAKDVRPYPPEPNIFTDGLPIATHENGQPWRLQFVEEAILLVGARGAGKSGVIWAVIDQLIPAINDRLVRLWVLDPKGGMEMAAGRTHYNRFVYGSDPAQYAIILEEAVRVMQRRQVRLRGVTRQHQPTTDEPLIVVIVDEMAALTAWAQGDTRQRIQSALSLLLSQGRAAGVTVIGAVQDPRKDIIPMRGLFTTRIALRLNEGEEVRMILGAAALNGGAKCHQIPKTLPGVGYVQIDGDPDIHRVRFAHVTDTMIRDFKAAPPQPEQTGETKAEPELAPLAKFGGFA
jgi:S-DNA-T family DNA segregation ATPase FtsK/SpoIIIE